MYYSTKNYGNDRGLSCCFRQWRATHSHCSKLHGYSLGFKFIFQSETLDGNDWVFDFGNFKAIKAWLDYMFDHTLMVAVDDPDILVFKGLQLKGLCNLREVEGIGCELFAKMAYKQVSHILDCFKSSLPVMIDNITYGSKYVLDKNIKLKSVEVYEHAGNSAIYEEN
jgi:6-pyruvoyltetrahydropterin/6-carboxytetrahydropterin synthase